MTVTEMRWYRASHPGILLWEELVERKISQKKFALLIGKTPTEVNEIIHWKRDITAQWAFLIGSALGISIEVRLNLQHNFDTHPKNIKNQQIKYKKKWEYIEQQRKKLQLV